MEIRSWISIGTNQHQLYPFIQKSDLVSVFGARDLLIIVYYDSFKICFHGLFVRKPFEPNHRQQPTPAQTRMCKGRSSLYGFGLGFQLQWADLATNLIHLWLITGFLWMSNYLCLCCVLEFRHFCIQYLFDILTKLKMPSLSSFRRLRLQRQKTLIQIIVFLINLRVIIESL